MVNWKRITVAVLLLTVVIAGMMIAWQQRRKHGPERVVRGQPAGYWIDHLTDRIPLNQMDMQWGGFGSNATPMLMEALERGSSWQDRIYQRVYAGAPAVVKQRLSPPNTSPEIRTKAMYLLSGMGPEAEPAVPLLVETLKSDPDRMMRLSAVESLERIKSSVPAGTNRTMLVGALASAVRDGDWMVRMDAAAGLGISPSEPEVAVPALVLGLGDTNAMVRQRAAGSLANFGTSAKGAVPSLVKALDEKDANARNSVVNALGKIDPAALVKASEPASAGK